MFRHSANMRSNSGSAHLGFFTRCMHGVHSCCTQRSTHVSRRLMLIGLPQISQIVRRNSLVTQQLHSMPMPVGVDD